MRFQITVIVKWETNGENPQNLPEYVRLPELEEYTNETICNYLSDEYGWLVSDWRYDVDTYLVREVIYDGEYQYGCTNSVSLYKGQEPTELAFIEEMYGKDSVYKDEWSKGWAFNADYRIISITSWKLIDDEDNAVLKKYGIL